MSENSTESPVSGRVPLTATRAVSVFGISVVGFMTANLVPVMIVALTGGPGLSVTAAGTLMTASLLACAASCLATSRWTARGGRYVVARAGLLLTALGFGAAALAPSVPVVVAGVVLGGLGAGGAVSAGGAALGALRDPDRASGINGFVNRGVVSVVLLAIPLLGAGTGSAFGLLAGLALAALLTTGWLPERPAPVAPPADGSSSTSFSSVRTGGPARTTTSAGLGLLLCFALWALSEDSLWAVAATMGAEQARLDETGMGLVLSLSTLGGLLATAAVGLLGPRLGRTVPLAVVLVAGGALKLLAGTVTDPGWYMVVVIAWNTLYAAAFVYVVAVAAALDASGRWSAPLLGIYLVGSAFAPVFGTAVSAAAGYTALGVVLAGMTFALLIPFLAVSRVSVRTEAAARQVPGTGFPQAAIV
ncbi:MFS transporter [Kocuria sp. NPDC057446]|uniref:MFS transporter n=1 Tax=Kocuria sp. NPDC057446 TaxID=3346137 RepID=UPI0036911735